MIKLRLGRAGYRSGKTPGAILFRTYFTESKEAKNVRKKQLTTSSGNPVGDNQNSLMAGPRGPLLMQDYQLLEKMATFNRERVPERIVHAKGSGAFGDRLLKK